jgi:DNA-binding transcriptional LysR family regulator
MEQVVESNGLRARMKMELTSNEAVKQAVIAGLGYSIMPLIGIKNELQTGQLRIIPVEGLPMITDWNLVWLQDKKLSPAAGAFVEHLRLEKDRIISREFGQLFEWG